MKLARELDELRGRARVQPQLIHDPHHPLAYRHSQPTTSTRLAAESPNRSPLKLGATHRPSTSPTAAIPTTPTRASTGSPSTSHAPMIGRATPTPRAAAGAAMRSAVRSHGWESARDTWSPLPQPA